MPLDCTLDRYSSISTCFHSPTFKSHDQLALLAYVLWKLGDSAANVPTTLDEQVSAIKCTSMTMSDDRLMGALIGLLSPGITQSSGILFATDVTQLTAETAAEAIKCLREIPEQQMKAMIVHNVCRIMSVAG